MVSWRTLFLQQLPTDWPSNTEHATAAAAAEKICLDTGVAQTYAREIWGVWMISS